MPHDRILPLVIFVITSYSTFASANEPMRARSLAIAVTSDHQAAYIAGLEDHSLHRLSSDSLELTQVNLQMGERASQTIVDLRLSADDGELVAIGREPHQLLIWSLDKLDAAPLSITLAFEPLRCSLTACENKHVACVTQRYEPAVTIVDLGQAGPDRLVNAQVWPLKFIPKEVCALDDGRFVVADAFGGKLSVINPGKSEVEITRELDGYHIGGLAFDAQQGVLHVTHQQLSSTAHTTQDDIHWGSLIKNVISTISIGDLTVHDDWLLKARLYRLGRVGKGAADPAGVVLHEGHRVVAISGSDELAIVEPSNKPPVFTMVGSVPDRLYGLGKSFVLCINRLDGTISIVDIGQRPAKEVKRLGQALEPTSAAERGQRAFYSAALSHDGWMSCNSCHIEGHTPDLLVDTLGDATHGSPKRIPSLHHVAHTAPWSWSGSNQTLADQLMKTLQTTMRGESEPATIEDLTAYLNSSVFAPPTSATHQTLKPPAIFETRCARCHRPDHYYTSHQTFDVGLRDENGTTHFNPPSLLGVAHRQRYMHDARYRSLQSLLEHHPQPAAQSEVEELLQFLKQL